MFFRAFLGIGATVIFGITGVLLTFDPSGVFLIRVLTFEPLSWGFLLWPLFILLANRPQLELRVSGRILAITYLAYVRQSNLDRFNEGVFNFIEDCDRLVSLTGPLGVIAIVLWGISILTIQYLIWVPHNASSVLKGYFRRHSNQITRDEE